MTRPARKAQSCQVPPARLLCQSRRQTEMPRSLHSQRHSKGMAVNMAALWGPQQA